MISLLREYEQSLAKPVSDRLKIWSIYFPLMLLSVFKLKVGNIDGTIFAAVVAVILAPFVRDWRVSREFSIFVGLVIFFFLFAELRVLVSKNFSDFYALKYFRAMLSLGSLLVIFLWLRSRCSQFTMIALVAGVAAFFVVVLLAQWALPDFKEWSYRLFYETGHFHDYRLIGFMNGTSSAGLFLGIGAFYLFYAYHVTGNMGFLALCVLCVPLFPYTAISGFFVFLVGVFFYLVLMRALNVRVFGGILLVFLFAFFVFAFMDRESKFAETVGLSDALSRIDALLGKDVDTRANPRRSFENLITKYELPLASDVFFGNAQPSKSVYATTSSDAGLIANLHAFGLFGILIMWAPIFYLLLFRDALVRALVFSFILVFLKNDLLYGRIVFDFFLAAVFISLLWRKHDVRVELFRIGRKPL